MINFIGIGAQKSGTSWVYACLYEHPEICAPIKEIHFFSRERYAQGKAWYETYFNKCDDTKKKGEFSTSYLYSKEAPERIHTLYPEVKLIAILRNPVTRAFSQYRNAVKAGEISEDMTFETYVQTEESAVAQGLYAEQLERYYTYIPKENLLVLIYEDIRKDPLAFMRQIYAYLGVDTTFVPSMLYDEINVARTPRRVFIDRMMHHTAEFLRKIGLDRLVYGVRKLGIPDLVRKFNTKQGSRQDTATYNRESLAKLFIADAEKLSNLCGRNMVSEWELITSS